CELPLCLGRFALQCVVAPVEELKSHPTPPSAVSAPSPGERGKKQSHPVQSAQPTAGCPAAGPTDSSVGDGAVMCRRRGITCSAKSRFDFMTFSWVLLPTRNIPIKWPYPAACMSCASHSVT